MKDTTTIKTLPGTLSPMKRDEYDADTSRMRSTALKDLVVPEQGPRAYYLKHVEPVTGDDEPADHFTLGILFHEWILEGKQNWAVATMARNPKHAAYQDFLAENAGKSIITATQERELHNWRDGLFRNKEARRVIEQGRYEEQVILWEVEVTFADDEGAMITRTVPCKAAIDLFPFGEHVRYCIKTAAGQGKWEWTVFDLGYHVSAAFYEWGVHSLPAYKEKPTAFSHIVVEKKAPYWCYVRPLSESALNYGRKDCELAIERYCECLRWQELYEQDGRPAIDAWWDLKERQQHIPVTPTQRYEEQYGEKRSLPAVTSHEPVAFEEGTHEHDIPDDYAAYIRQYAAGIR